MIFDVLGLFSDWSQCGRSCGNDWSWFLMCQVYSVFDLSVREVVGMTGGDFWCTRSIQYSISMLQRLWIWLELIFHIPGLFHIKFGIWSHCREGCGYYRRWFLMCQVYSVFDLSMEEVAGMTGVNFSHSGLFHIKFSIWSWCEEGYGYDRRWFLMCQVYSVFNLTVREVVGMTGGDV